MRIVSIVGARPQFIKLGPVSRAMSDEAVTGGLPLEDIIVHTGQHYDAGMSDVFFDELELPRPAIHLGVGSGHHGAQTARMLEAIEAALMDLRPDWVVVYGDTNSTLAGALAAAKMRIPIAHIEAGLRSLNRDMPEEINRIVTDHVSDLLFAPTNTAIENLARENLHSRSVYSGDVMLDAIIYNSKLAEDRSRILDKLGLVGHEYAVATLHRASNTDSEILIRLLDTFNIIASKTLPIVFPVHPRTIARLETYGKDWQAADGLSMIKPVGYLDMLKLLKHARVALTDSGGLQKEALFVGTPCVTFRDETEWPETVEEGGNILAGADPERIVRAVDTWIKGESFADRSNRADPFGDGNAAPLIVRRLMKDSEPTVP